MCSMNCESARGPSGSMGRDGLEAEQRGFLPGSQALPPGAIHASAIKGQVTRRSLDLGSPLPPLESAQAPAPALP